VTSVDKANVLETSRLWREVVSGLAGDYPDVRLEHMLVDNAGLQLVLDPAQFDVILTENTFGDILSDVAAGSCGGLGVLPRRASANWPPAFSEPVHGSAPDIAGQGIANQPARSARLRCCCDAAGENELADQLERAVDTALK
jgi:3-isopropylmalate dehydrogenase